LPRRKEQVAADVDRGNAENMTVWLDDPGSRIEFERTKETVLRDLAPPRRWTQVIGHLVRVSMPPSD
jgi:hypothetical protein